MTLSQGYAIWFAFMSGHDECSQTFPKISDNQMLS